MRAFGPLSYSVVGALKFQVILLKKDEIKECLLKVAEKWNETFSEEKKLIIRKDVKSARLLTTFSIILMYSAEIFYSSTLPFFIDDIVVDNHTISYMSFQSYFPFFNPHVSNFLIKIIA